MNINRAKQLLGLCMQARVSALLVGHSGVGKTAVVGQTAEELFPDHKFVKIMASQQEVGDFVGIPTKATSVDPVTGEEVIRTVWARPEWMPEEPVVLFLDEVNQASRDVEAALFQLVDEKRIHTHHLHPESVVVAAINPSTSEYTTANVMSTAMQKRFIVIPFTPTAEEVMDWGHKTGKIHKELLGFVSFDRTHAGLDKDLDTAIKVTPSPRQLERASQLIQAAELSNKNATQDVSLMSDILGCTLGHESTAVFLSYMKSKAKPLTFEQVTGNWEEFGPVFQSYQEQLKNDLVAETIRNVQEGLKGIEELHGKTMDFSHPTHLIDSDEYEKELTKEITHNIEEVLGRGFANNFMCFLQALPDDLFYSFSYDFVTRCPFNENLEIDENNNRNNVHFALFAYFWGEKFTHKANMFNRLEKNRDNISQFVKASENVDL